MRLRHSILAQLVVLGLALLVATPGLAQQSGGSSYSRDAFGDLEAVIIPVADIAGNDGWMMLDEAMEKYGLDAEFERMVMEGGGEITCLGKNDAGQTVVKNRFVGWFLDGATDKVHTVGHFIYDRQHEVLSDMPGCHLALNAQVAEGDRYVRNRVDANPRSYLFGGTNPADRRSGGDDRAIIPLLDGIPVDPAGDSVARAVESIPNLVYRLKPGDPVTMVSAARPFHRHIKGNVQPMVQRCHVLGVEPGIGDQPGILRTDCDSFKGVSGSLFFAEDPDSGRMVAIAMQIRVQHFLDDHDKPIDGLPASLENNASISLAIDSRYFDYPYSIKDLAPRSDRWGGEP